LKQAEHTDGTRRGNTQKEHKQKELTQGVHIRENAATPSLNEHSSEVNEMTLQAIKTSVLKFVKDEDGLTIVEYAVGGGLITLGVVAAFILLGDAVDTNIRDLCGAVSSRGAAPTPC